jgi:probable phosphoglycerate mutase
MPMPLLYLIRHGETPLNVARVLQPAATPLSERGRAQARALGERLRGAGLAGIVCSDLPRARETAALIASACMRPAARAGGRGPLAVEHTALLRERDFGAWRGRPYDALGFDPLAVAEAPPGGESLAAFDARCACAWDDLLRRQAACGGALAAITHGLVLRAWLRHGRVELGDTSLPAALANTALSIVDVAPPHRVRLLACTAHLTGGAAHAEGSLVGG